MTHRQSIYVGALAGLFLGAAIGAFVGWASSNPIHFEMEARHTPSRYEAMLRDVSTATKRSKSEVGTAIGVIFGGTGIALAGAMLGSLSFRRANRKPPRQDAMN